MSRFEEEDRYTNDGEEHVASMLSTANAKPAKFVDYYYTLTELMEGQLEAKHSRCVAKYVISLMESVLEAR